MMVPLTRRDSLRRSGMGMAMLGLAGFRIADVHGEVLKRILA